MSGAERRAGDRRSGRCRPGEPGLNPRGRPNRSQCGELSAKLRRIHEIQASGFQVAHVIHRHGLDEAAATEMETALMDVYPGLTNLQGGKISGDRVVMHADEINRRVLEQDPVAQCL